MIGRLFTVASVLSLLLFAATLALWIRSYQFAYEALRVDHQTDVSTSQSLLWSHGGLQWCREVVNRGDRSGWRWSHHIVRSPPPRDQSRRAQAVRALANPLIGSPRRWFERLGFQYRSFEVRDPTFDEPYIYRATGLVAPFYAICPLLLALPLAKCSSLYRKRLRRINGRCTRCGYDLRASTDRCPECGTPIPAEAKA